MFEMIEKICPVCGGTGRVRRDLPVDHRDFGKLVACPDRSHNGERQAHLLRQSGLKSHERLYRVDNLVEMDATTPELIAALREFLDEPAGWLYIWGGPGNGKTLALMAAVAEFIRRGIPALYISLADLLNVMRETFKFPQHSRASEMGEDAWRRWDTYQARFERVRDVPLLAIDEFDGNKINETDFAIEFRARLIDHRYRDAVAHKTFTLLAGNDDPALLPQWIYDRVRDGRFKVFEHRGQSVRPAMEW